KLSQRRTALLGENNSCYKTRDRYQRQRLITNIIALPHRFLKLVRRQKNFFKKSSCKLRNGIDLKKELIHLPADHVMTTAFLCCSHEKSAGNLFPSRRWVL